MIFSKNGLTSSLEFFLMREVEIKKKQEEWAYKRLSGR